MEEQYWRNINGGTVLVEQWISSGRTVTVQQYWWNSGTEMVE